MSDIKISDFSPFHVFRPLSCPISTFSEHSSISLSLGHSSWLHFILMAQRVLLLWIYFVSILSPSVQIYTSNGRHSILCASSHPRHTVDSPQSHISSVLWQRGIIHDLTLVRESKITLMVSNKSWWPLLRTHSLERPACCKYMPWTSWTIKWTRVCDIMFLEICPPQPWGPPWAMEQAVSFICKQPWRLWGRAEGTVNTVTSYMRMHLAIIFFSGRSDPWTFPMQRQWGASWSTYWHARIFRTNSKTAGSIMKSLLVISPVN